MKLFHSLFMLIIVFVFSTGIQAATPDREQSLKNVISADFGINAAEVVLVDFNVFDNEITLVLTRQAEAELLSSKAENYLELAPDIPYQNWYWCSLDKQNFRSNQNLGISELTPAYRKARDAI